MKYIQVEDKENIRTIRLQRPGLHNAFNPEMIEELTQAFNQVNQDSTIKAVVLSGEGKSFCAGADLTWMKSMVNYTLEENKKDSLKLFDMFAALRNCAAPVISHVHGNVFGGGLGLVAASDIVLAEHETKFCFSEVKLGLAPAVISPFVIQRVNESFAREWMLTAKVFTSDEALEGELINFTGSTEEVQEYKEQLLKRLRNSGVEAVRATKQLLNDSKSLTWQERREKTAQVIAERRVSAEGQEGLASFFEKRKPNW